jgi:peptidoglycan hydrolase-like protein with peptidoglycan-binding domain
MDQASPKETSGTRIPSPTKPRQRFWRRHLLTLSLSTALAVAAVPLMIPHLQSKASSPETTAHTPATTAVQHGTLSGAVQVPGTLDFAEHASISTSSPGVLTMVPKPGSTVSLGQPLFAVNNTPVPLLHGILPAWRSFEIGMDDGPDILQLETNLKTLGYFKEQPDKTFTWHTVQSARAWQKSLGIEQTGAIPIGSIVFAAADLRVAATEALPGAQTPGAVIKTTSLAKRVTADLRLSNQNLAAVGTKVTLSLPGGTDTPGTVAEIGAPTERVSGAGAKEMVIPVSIEVDLPATVEQLQRASVMVAFPSQQRENVLYVPVEALVALDSRTFGVEIADPAGSLRKVPVATGMFADGKVEISGDDIAAGQNVVIPA